MPPHIKDEIIRLKADIKALTNIIQRRTKRADKMPTLEKALEKVNINDFRILRRNFQNELKRIKKD